MPLFLIEGAVTRRHALQVEAETLEEARERFVEVVSDTGTCEGMAVLDSDEVQIRYHEQYRLEDDRSLWHVGGYPFSTDA